MGFTRNRNNEDYPSGLTPSPERLSDAGAGNAQATTGAENLGAKGLFRSVACAGSKVKKFSGALALTAGLLIPAQADAGPRDIGVIVHPGLGPLNSEIVATLDSSPEFTSVTPIVPTSTTPSAAQLNQYGAVLVAWSISNLPDDIALGNALADYYDAGGGVVCALSESADAFLDGRWATDYQVMARPVPGDGVSSTLAAYDAAHPIMDAIATLGANVTVDQNAGVTPGSTIVASFNTGAAAVATKKIGTHHVVDLGFYLWSTNVDGTGWHAATDADQVIINALLYSMEADFAAIDDDYSVAEDGVLTVATRGVLANDTDAAGPEFQVSVTQDVQHGSLNLLSDGSFVYTPATDYTGPDSFTYVLSDGSGATDTALVNIDVVAVGDDPVAIDDNYVINEGGTLTLNGSTGVLMNDVAPDGGTKYAYLVNGPSHGTLNLTTNGSVTYTPTGNFNGTDSFVYYMANGTKVSNAATVTITVNPTPDTPIVSTNSYSTLKNTPLTVAAPGVLDDDYDPDGDALTALLAGDGTTDHGSVVLNADGSFVYTPAANFVGTDSFLYKATDGVNKSASTEVTISIGATNAAPVALDDFYALDQGVTLTKNAAEGILKNDSDPDANPIGIVLTKDVQFGVLNLNLASGNFNYTPFAGFSGTDTFEYKVNDGSLDSEVATVTFTVNSTNGNPTAVDDIYNTAEDTPLTIGAPGVLANDHDNDEFSNLTATLASNPEFGTVALNPDGSFTYTPMANYNSDAAGDDSFTYTVSDGMGGSSTAEVVITVASVLDKPVATDDTYTLLQNTNIGEDWPVSVLINDTFEMPNPFSGQQPPPPAESGSGDSIAPPPAPSTGLVFGTGTSYVIMQDDVDHGELEVLPILGLINYTPEPGFTGTDSFTYFIATLESPSPFFPFPLENVLISNTATVTFNVLAGAPVAISLDASDDNFAVAEDGVLTAAVPGVLANDVGPTTTTMVATVQYSTNNGSLVLNADGSFVYTPDADFQGGDWFTYTLSDGTGLTDTATVGITVVPVNDDPVAIDDNYVINEGIVLTRTAANSVLLNDVIPDGGAATVHRVNSPSHGTLTFGTDGAITYTPAVNFAGEDSFTYYIKNGTKTSNQATVNITVMPTPDAPYAASNAYSTLEGVALVVDAPGVLADDFDPEGDDLKALLIGNGVTAHGSVTLNLDGSFVYTPAAGYVGVDQFYYKANDGFLNSANAEVKITVGESNEAPLALDDFYILGQGDSLVKNGAAGVLKNDSDPEGDTLTITLTKDVEHGVLNLNLNAGSFNYTPFASFSGTDTFQYKVNDGVLDSEVVTVTLTVVAPTVNLTANNDNFGVLEDTVLTVAPNGVMANDTGPVPADMMTLIKDNPLHGAVTILADGSFEYTPDEGYNGPDFFTYTLSDGSGNTDAARVNINIAAAGDNPVAVDDTFTVGEDGGFNPTVLPLGVLQNDFSPDGRLLTAHIQGQNPAHATWFGLNPDGTFTYVPNSNYNGTDSFTYYVKDDLGALSEIATVYINVTPAQDAPAGINNDYATPLDTVLEVAAPGVLVDDADIDGDDITAHLVGAGPQNGFVTMSPDGSFTYTPGTGFVGMDKFFYRVKDTNNAYSDNIRVRIFVGASNQVPVALADYYTINYGETLSTTIPDGVLGNDSDPEGDPLTVTLVQDTQHGDLNLNLTNGRFIYEPNPGFSGVDTFQYKVNDGSLDSAVVTVTITVREAPEVVIPLDAINDGYSVAEDGVLIVAAPGVLANDQGPTTTTLLSSVVNSTEHGELVLQNDGSFVYTPTADYHGSDKFTYTLSDGTGITDVATAYITVVAVGDAPVAVNDTFVVAEDTSLTLTSANGIRVNDLNPDGGSFSVRLISGPSSGTLFLQANGALDYKAYPNVNGTDSFTYYVENAFGISAPATVTITILPVQDVPVAIMNNYSTPQDVTLVVEAPGVLVDDTDADGDPLIALLTGNGVTAENGSVALNPDGSFTYTPAIGFVGVDSFWYKANDGMNDSATTRTRIFVGDTNDAPVALSDFYSLNEGHTLTVGAAEGVLKNDSDADGPSPLVVVPVEYTHAGDLTLNPDGSFEYTPYPGHHGTDSFSYKAFDGQLDSNVVTVTFTIMPVNSDPVAIDDLYSTAEDTLLTVAAPGVLANDYDSETELGSLTASLVGGPDFGTVVLNPDGSFTYTPKANFSSELHGSDEFGYVVSDGNGGMSVATVSVWVASVVDHPVAVDDSYTLLENTTMGTTWPLSVLANDTFEMPNPFFGEGQPQPAPRNAGEAGAGVTGRIAPPPASSTGLIFGTGTSFVILQDNVDHGTFELDPMFGVFEYTPNPGFSGTDSFTYFIATIDSDNPFFPFPLEDAFISNTATVTFTVLNTNDAPVANIEMYTTTEDQPLVVSAPGVLSNDDDLDGNSLTALVDTNPLHGTLLLNADGSFIYIPDGGFSGSDSFKYKANDGTEDSNVVTVGITVIGVNDAPVAVNDTYVTNEDTTLTVVMPGLLQNDIDEPGDTLTASIVVPPLHGTLESWPDGAFKYVPNANYSGTDQFVYRVSDGSLSSNDAVASITIVPVQDVPVANENHYSIQENAVLSVPASGVLSNDTDADGDILAAIQEDGPTAGQLTAFPGDGSFIYTPNLNFNGVDTFTYRADDGFGTPSEVTTVTITVGPVNDAPVAVNDNYNVYEDTVTTVSAPGVLANDTDSDDTILSATLINGPINGNVELRPDGSFTYTPFENYNGPDSFTYQSFDGLADSNVATVSINVVPIDDVPLANEDFYVVDEDQFITVATPGVLGNDSDSDGSVLNALLQQEPPHGEISLNGDGGFTYTPDPGYSGDDYFVYLANDGVSNSEPTTATIVVRPRNDRPVAIADNYVVNEDEVLTLAAPGVLSNDTDQDDDVLTVTLEIAPLYGTLTLNDDGSFVYDSDLNFNGTDSFTYRAGDGIELSNPAVVTITVAPVADLPVANADNYSTPEDTLLVVAPQGVLANDVDVDGHTLNALLVDNAANGVVTLNADGSFNYMPNPGFNGADTFTYQASDGEIVSALPATIVTITVGPVNDLPVANDDVYSLFEDTTAVIADPGVLQNDTDSDPANTLTANVIIPPLHGTLTLNPAGGFTYTPALDFTGVDSFTYQVNDGTADSNVATVTLNVVEQSDVPLANADAYSTTEEVPLVVATPGVLGNDLDVDNQLLIALLEDNPLHGTVALDGDGSFVYTPDDGFNGTDTFSYRANDGTQNSDAAIVTITVHPRNDAPVSVDDIYNATEDETLTVPVDNGVLKNDSDLDGDVLHAILINQPLNGSVVLADDGSFVYTPNENFNGEDYFTYSAYDTVEYSTPSKVVINVAPVPDKPVGVADMYSIPEDKVLIIVAPGVLGNDHDDDHDPLTGILVDHPENGILQFNATGGFSYTPDEDFFGIDEFTYFVNDGHENSDLTTVTIRVGGRNDGPVAVDDLYYTPEDVPLNITAPGVLGNDVDDDGDTLQSVIITPPLHGVLALNLDGSFVYTPNLSYTGEDRFVYRAKDSVTMSNPATVTIMVSPINDPPVLSNVVVTPALNENDMAVLTADLFDADLTDTFLVSVNWGDGGMPTMMAYPAGTSKIFLTHQYLDDNPTGTPADTNVVVLTVQDNNGGADTLNSNVVVSNLLPNFENVTLTQVVPTGGQARLQGTITDIGTLDTFVLTVNWGDGNIDTYNHGPGASTFDYIHTYAVPGSYTVTATVVDDDSGTRMITPSILVRNTSDMILSKTANPDPASVGELVTYTMIVSNNGPDMAHNVILMDTLPSNVQVTSSTPALVHADGVLNWFLGDMASGQTIRVDLVVKTLQQGPVTNIATVISDELDPNQANNTASVTTTIGWLPDGPDLMAEAITVDTVCKLTKKGTKCKMKLWALVTNRGTQDANRSIYSVYLSDDNMFSPMHDMKLKTKKFKKLKPLQSQGQKQTIKLPTGYTTTGKFMIVVLDEGNLVFEGNETNNLIIYGPLP